MGKKPKPKDPKDVELEKTVLSTTGTARKFIEDEYTRSNRQYDWIDTRYLWDRNIRTNIYKENKMIDSRFLEITADGVVDRTEPYKGRRKLI